MDDHWREVIKVLDSTWAHVQSLGQNGIPHQTMCCLWEHYEDMRNTIISYFAQQGDPSLADPTAKMTADSIRQIIHAVAPQTNEAGDSPKGPPDAQKQTIEDGLARFQDRHPGLVAAARERMSRNHGGQT